MKVRQQTTGTQLWPLIRGTYRQEGISGFYKGMLLPLLTLGPTNSLFFGIYGNALKYMQSTSDTQLQNNDKQMNQVYFAGCIGGLGSVVLTCPIELVKTILQVDTKKSDVNINRSTIAHEGRKMLKCAKTIYKSYGIQGLYRGGVATICRDVPSYGVYMLMYELLLKEFAGLGHVSSQILAGGNAGVIAWMSCIPFDVVKSRIQADDPNNPRYNGMLDCFRKSYRSNGYTIFTKGLLAVSVRAFVVNAATFVAYEAIYEFLRSHL